MERFTLTRDGRTERWELTREATTLTERVLVDGREPVTRTARCDSEATADGVAARMIARHERAGFVRDPEAPAPSSAPGDAAPRPAYPGLTDKQLGSLVHAVAKAAPGDAHKIGMAIHKVLGDWHQRVAMGWHLARHGLVDAAATPGLWELLAERPGDVEPEALLALLARLPAGAAFAKLYKHGAPSWFTPGFDRCLDELLFAAYQRDPELFEGRASELTEAARLALDFVRARSGRSLPPPRARAIVRHIARAQCHHGLASNWEFPRVVDGAVARPRLASPDDVRAVALMVAPAEVWREAMVDAVRDAKELSLHAQRDGLVACGLDLLTAKLAGAFSFSDNNNLARILALLDARGDAPEELVAAAASITSDRGHPAEVRDMLAVVAAGRFAAQGREVPEAVDALLDLSFFSGVYHVSVAPCVRALAALPRERALAIARRRLDQPHGYAPGLGPLLAHHDDELLGRLVDLDAPNGYLDAGVLGRFGALALPHLARVWDAAPRSARRARHRAALECLARIGDEGATADPSWDHAVTFDAEGDTALEYWDPSYATVRERALRALPPERRLAQLVACARTRPYPERARAAAEATLDAAGVAAVDAAIATR